MMIDKNFQYEMEITEEEKVWIEKTFNAEQFPYEDFDKNLCDPFPTFLYSINENKVMFYNYIGTDLSEDNVINYFTTFLKKFRGKEVITFSIIESSNVFFYAVCAYEYYTESLNKCMKELKHSLEVDVDYYAEDK